MSKHPSISDLSSNPFERKLERAARGDLVMCSVEHKRYQLHTYDHKTEKASISLKRTSEDTMIVTVTYREIRDTMIFLPPKQQTLLESDEWG